MNKIKETMKKRRENSQNTPTKKNIDVINFSKVNTKDIGKASKIYKPEKAELIVQINGSKIGLIQTSTKDSEAVIKNNILNDISVLKALGDKTIKYIVIIPTVVANIITVEGNEK